MTQPGRLPVARAATASLSEAWAGPGRRGAAAARPRLTVGVRVGIMSSVVMPAVLFK